jgi:alpha-glucosidase
VTLASVTSLSLAVVLGIADCGLRTRSRIDWAVQSTIQSTIRNPQSSIRSPNGLVSFELDRNASGGLIYTVRLGADTVVEPSPLGIVVDGNNLGEGVEIGRAQAYTIDERYPWYGVHATAVNRCRGSRVPLTQKATRTTWTLDARACDDGAAFRYIVPGSAGVARTPDEATTFRWPEGAFVWSHDFEGHYEGVHAKQDVAAVPAGQWAAPPLTVKLPRNAGYASITESALIGYGGLALRADGRRAYAARLGHEEPVSYPYRLRYTPDDIARLSKPAAIAGTITSPWRVVMTGRTLNALVNTDIVHNLAPPPDSTLFPQGISTPWVKPGRAVWRFLDGGDNTFEGAKAFTRLGQQLGFEYHVVEGLWQRWTDEQMRDFMDDAAQRHVGIWLWKDSRALATVEEQRAFFDKCRALGVVGAKIDFFDHEAKEMVDRYQSILRESAERHIMVNFHGANKPAGEARTWPHELTREGVYGLEHRQAAEWARHNTTLPFTRFLAGAADYTPVVFGERRKETSWAHQIATAAVFTSPVLVFGGHPQSLLDNPAVEMIKSLPSTWDETIVLPSSEIGELAAVARRRGTTWFVAVLNGPVARTLRVDLGFLGQGRYDALVVRDRSDDAAAVVVEQARASAGAPLTIDLRAAGGFIARLTTND